MWLYSKHVVLFLLRFRRGNESVRNRFIDQYAYIKGNFFFLSKLKTEKHMNSCYKHGVLFL